MEFEWELVFNGLRVRTCNYNMNDKTKTQEKHTNSSSLTEALLKLVFCLCCRAFESANFKKRQRKNLRIKQLQPFVKKEFMAELNTKLTKVKGKQELNLILFFFFISI